MDSELLSDAKYVKQDKIKIALFSLKQYIEASDYKGYDPYDGLTSPLFHLPILKSNHTLRFWSQQLVKRSPVNLRTVLGINRQLNPVTAGLCLQAYAALNDHAKSDKMMELLQLHHSKGFKGLCWGYNFPWAARYADIPAYYPTVVATGINTNAVYKYYLQYKSSSAAEMILSACDFVLNDLNRSEDKDGSICFSYSPNDHEQVYNASMKAVRILSQGYAVSGNIKYMESAEKAVRYVVNRQETDGKWKYSESKTGTRTDSYHTGYILDCLKSYMDISGDERYNHEYQKGLKYFTDHFILPDGRPAFYNDESWPADCTSAAQCILTLINNGYEQKAELVAEWMIEHMQKPNGSFRFRKFASHTENISFMRWADAWMFAALAELVNYSENKN